MRTKRTRAPCRKRTGTIVTRADNFGDLISADHKVLREGCESRNNHRHAIVVQDLATQWIQSYPCKTKTSQETTKSFQKFLEPTWKPKVVYTDNTPGMSAKPVKIYPGIIARLHHTDQKHNGIAEKSSAQSERKVRLQYCCTQVLLKNGGRIP